MPSAWSPISESPSRQQNSGGSSGGDHAELSQKAAPTLAHLKHARSVFRIHACLLCLRDRPQAQLLWYFTSFLVQCHESEIIEVARDALLEDDAAGRNREGVRGSSRRECIRDQIPPPVEEIDRGWQRKGPRCRTVIEERDHRQAADLSVYSRQSLDQCSTRRAARL